MIVHNTCPACGRPPIGVPCCPHGERLAWLRRLVDAETEDRNRLGEPPDRIAAAAEALGEKYGWYDDPVLTADTALEIVEFVARALGGDQAEVIGNLRGLLQAFEPRVACPQCGSRYTEPPCGPTHAIVHGEIYPQES